MKPHSATRLSLTLLTLLTLLPATALAENEIISLNNTSPPTTQTCRNNNATLPLPAKTIFQMPKGDNFTFFENIVSRSNGDLLIAMVIPEPNIYLLQNPGSACPTFSPLFKIPGPVNGTDGITEINGRPDTFAVIAGNISLSGDPANGVPNSWAVWELALSGGFNASVSGLVKCPPPASANATTNAVHRRAANGTTTTLEQPKVVGRKIADFPMAPRLNGIAGIPGSASVLVGDSQLGVVFHLDTLSGNITTAFDFPEMKPVPGAGSVDDALGLNGLKVGPDGFLYFTNAAARTINRIAMVPDGRGPEAGAVVQTIAAVPGAQWMDDLDLRDDGSLWVTTNSGTNAVLAIEPTVAGTFGPSAQYRSPVLAVGGNATSEDNMVVAGCVAGVFGRGTSGKHNLYVATGSGDEPAKIVRIDTSPCQ